MKKIDVYAKVGLLLRMQKTLRSLEYVVRESRQKEKLNNIRTMVYYEGYIQFKNTDSTRLMWM